MTLLREIQTRLAPLQKRIDAVLEGRPVPTFTIVRIGPMLWTRFERADDALNMTVHAAGPASEDVVIVTAARAEGGAQAGPAPFLRRAAERAAGRVCHSIE